MSNVNNGIQGYRIDNPYNTVSHHNCDHNKISKGNPGNGNYVTYDGDTVTLHRGKSPKAKDVEVETLEKKDGPNVWQKAAGLTAAAAGIALVGAVIPPIGLGLALAGAGTFLVSGLLALAGQEVAKA